MVPEAILKNLLVLNEQVVDLQGRLAVSELALRYVSLSLSAAVPGALDELLAELDRPIEGGNEDAENVRRQIATLLR